MPLHEIVEAIHKVSPVKKMTVEVMPQSNAHHITLFPVAVLGRIRSNPLMPGILEVLRKKKFRLRSRYDGPNLFDDACRVEKGGRTFFVGRLEREGVFLVSPLGNFKHSSNKFSSAEIRSARAKLRKLRANKKE